MSVDICGKVTRSEARRYGRDDAVVLVVLDAGLRLPFEVRFLFKADDRKPKVDPLLVAERYAALQRIGMNVCVRASALRHRTDHGEECFVVEAPFP
jgi:hypothetical protein